MAALAVQAVARKEAGVLGFAPTGWRNVPSQDQRRSFESGAGRHDVSYRISGREVRASVDGVALGRVRLHECREGVVDLERDSVRRRYLVATNGEQLCLDGPHGSAELRELARFPDAEPAAAAGSLAAPMPGKVIEVRVAVGDRVEAGAVLVVLEAMKMEQKVTAPAAGVVSEIRASAGDQVEAGRVLAVIDEGA